MQLIYSAELSLFIIIILKHTYAAVLYWYWFKNSVMTEIRPLYLQPFTNSHFHFPIILESATCQVLLQWSELHYSFLWFEQ